MAQSPRPGVSELCRWWAPKGEANEEFDRLLAEAQALAGVERGDEALEAGWSARRLARRQRLERVGEADLTIGRLLLDLDRMNEGLEAVSRAARYFARRGEFSLRGAAEAVLAEAAWRRGDDHCAEAHVRVAGDLLLTSADPLGASAALDGHAERLDAAGLRGGAARMRCEARRLLGVASVP